MSVAIKIQSQIMPPNEYQVEREHRICALLSSVIVSLRINGAARRSCLRGDLIRSFVNLNFDVVLPVAPSGRSFGLHNLLTCSRVVVHYILISPWNGTIEETSLTWHRLSDRFVYRRINECSMTCDPGMEMRWVFGGLVGRNR